MLLQQPLIYCHFANGGEDPSYMPVKDWEVLKSVLTQALDDYNELNAAMHLVLFEDAMQHVWVGLASYDAFSQVKTADF